MNLDLVVFFQKAIYLEHDGAYLINLNDKNSKKHIGFHYLLK